MPNISARNIFLHYPIFGYKSSESLSSGNLKNLHRSKFGHYLTALENISFDIEEGEGIGLVGRNGSGKSTLLRVLGGIYTPTAGSLSIKGKVTSMFSVNLGVQRNATGRENIVLRGIIKGLSQGEIRAKMDDIIAFSELESVIDFPVRTYSSGMAMRLSFSIATSFEHEILLLDEWIGAGDRQFQNKAAERMNNVVDHSRITVIASHNRALLKRICTKLIWLDEGVLRVYGPTEDVYAAMDEAYKNEPRK